MRSTRLFVATLILALVAGNAAAAPDTALLPPATLAALASAGQGASVIVEAVPDGFGGSNRLRFERIDVYAPGARVLLVDAAGQHELPRSDRVQWIGSSADGSVRSSLAFDPGFRNVSGVGSAPSGTFVLSAVKGDHGVQLHAAPAERTLPAGVNPQILNGDDGLASGNVAADALALSLAGATPSVTARSAVVAIDTDTEFMVERFNGNTTAATHWIADLFAAMNVMYRRDLNVTLQAGTTLLRPTSDPYVQNATPANGADLNEFGAYWQATYASVPRSFAMLLSGKASSGNSASGIAWINAYCKTQSQGGSYSVNQVFTNPGLDVSYSALIVAHEIGHNFGAYHTHCTSTATGGAPTAANTIDKCYSGESGCYSGATSCPTTGPGAPAGTIMSYCNTRSCGSGGQNVLQFHPTQIGVLSTLINQNAACFAANADEIFGNGFE